MSGEWVFLSCTPLTGECLARQTGIVLHDSLHDSARLCTTCTTTTTRYTTLHDLHDNPRG